MFEKEEEEKDIVPFVDEVESKSIVEGFVSTPLEDYGDFELSEKGKERMSAALINMKAGLISVSPIQCQGPGACPFRSKCPIYQADGNDGVYPLSKQCILEASYARDKFLEYLDHFELTHEDVRESPTLRSLVSKLGELDVYDIRLSMILAGTMGHDGSLLLEQAIAMSQEGDDITQLQEHPAWRIKEKVHRQRMEILDVLEATPKAQTRRDTARKIASGGNYMARQKNLIEKMEKLAQEAEKSDK